jgi:putative intracellular protease/amidase
MKPRILMILTSNARMGNSGKTTGVWAEELAVPYLAFVAAGAAVELASPQGGPVPFDPGSIKPAGQNSPEVDSFLAHPEAQRQVQQTLPLHMVDAASFDALFFPGGHGTMWDLPDDAEVTRLVQAAAAADRVIASVCHGAAGLIGAKGSDGRAFVAGKRVNAFTNDEEAAVGLANVVPFALETRLRELGALFEKAPNWQPFAVQDGKLVTGQNPASSALVARHVLELLTLQPAQRPTSPRVPV